MVKGSIRGIRVLTKSAEVYSRFSKRPADDLFPPLRTGTGYLILGLTDSTIPPPSRMVRI